MIKGTKGKKEIKVLKVTKFIGCPSMCKNSKRDMCKETEGVVASVSKRLSTEGLVGKTGRSVVKCNSLDGGSQGGCCDRDSSTMGHLSG